MRRAFFIIMIMLFGYAAIASAQRGPEQVEEELLIPPVAEVDQMVKGRWVPIELEAIPDPSSVLGRALNAGNDTCNMTVDNLPTFNQLDNIYTSSDATQVNGYTVDVNDPDLTTCFDNTTQSTIGYRTAWYRFTAPATGALTIDIIPNADYNDNYDTVVALYHASSCGAVNLTTLAACNDDANGLLSQIIHSVEQDEIYFIEVLDRNLGVNTTARANITVQIETTSMEETDESWNVTTAGQPNAHRSRHSTFVANDEIYVVAGQTFVDEDTSTRIANVAKFTPATGEWMPLAAMHHDCGSAEGYSNTGIAYVEYSVGATNFRKAFMPSGFVGDDGIYANTHCIYDVDTNTWAIDTANTAPWSTGTAAAYPVVVSRPNVGYVVAGGLNGQWLQPTTVLSTQAVSDTLQYNAASNSWTVKPGLNSPRYAHTGVMLNNNTEICVVGGLQPSASGSILLTSGECLDVNSGTSWSSIAGNNTPRFNAASYVDSNGVWYVFGGVDANLDAVASTEVYDQATNTWTTLDNRFAIKSPARAWMRGGVVNDALYLIGGEAGINNSGNGLVAGLVTKFRFPATTVGLTPAFYLPLITNDYTRRSLDWQATDIAFGQKLEDNFDNNITDRFDVFKFEVTTSLDYKLSLTNIPLNADGVRDDYDLWLYSDTKVPLRESTNIGNNPEIISGTLGPGTYYILVIAKVNAPTTTGNYHLTLEQN